MSDPVKFYRTDLDELSDGKAGPLDGRAAAQRPVVTYLARPIPEGGYVLIENETVLTESQPQAGPELADLINYVPLPANYYDLSARQRVDALRLTLDSLAVGIEALAAAVLRNQPTKDTAQPQGAIEVTGE